MKNALTIAGSDSSGGAGIQADLKTFSAHGVYGMSVITAVTAQNTQKVMAVEDLSPKIIGEQIQAVFEDIEVHAVKIGMVSQIDSIRIIHDRLHQYHPKNVVVDPVMVSKSGYHLLNPEAVSELITLLIPSATLVTPNIPEAELITGMKIRNINEMQEAAVRIHQFGPKNVLIKGGHLSTESDSVDLLYDGSEIQYFRAPRIPTKNTHGTGCTLSSAIAANLAKGYLVAEAVGKAKEYLNIAILHSITLGKGVGPTHQFYSLYQKAGILE